MVKCRLLLFFFFLQGSNLFFPPLSYQRHTSLQSWAWCRDLSEHKHANNRNLRKWWTITRAFQEAGRTLGPAPRCTSQSCRACSLWDVSHLLWELFSNKCRAQEELFGIGNVQNLPLNLECCGTGQDWNIFQESSGVLYQEREETFHWGKQVC